MADIDKIKALKAQGKTHRQIATELGISKSTVSNKLRFAQNQEPVQPKPMQSSPDPTQAVHFIPRGLPPGASQWAVPPVQQYSGIFRAGQNFYIPADQAIIESRENARRMWNNLTIREALQNRLWAAAQQAGHVEPEDAKDPMQVQIASEIQQVIENIPDFLKLKYTLLKSRFFGVYGVQLKYIWKAVNQEIEAGGLKVKMKQNRLSVKAWSPVHGDSIIFKQDSDDLGIYTTMAGGQGVKPITTESGYIGRVHVLDDGREIHYDERGLPYQQVGVNERQAFILMAYEYEPADFLNSRQAGGVKGLGIRNTLYPTWYIAQEILGNLVDFVERYATGITMYKFLRGNEASFNAARELAESASNQSVVMVPVEPDINNGKPIEGVERIEVPATGLEGMIKVIEEVFNKQMRLFIVGQDSTSRQVHGGLGSKLSGVQENTFNRIVRFDCQDLSETLTSQLVSVLQEWNHPGTDFECKWVIDLDKPHAKEQLEAIKDAYDMGVSFIEDEVRGLVGLSKPTVDDVVIKKGPEIPMLPGLTSPINKPPIPGEEEEEPEDNQNPFD